MDFSGDKGGEAGKQSHKILTIHSIIVNVLSFLRKMSAEINPYAKLGSSLTTRIIGQRIIYYPRLASTMDIARQEARRGASEGTVIIAGEQTRGRGRMQRLWLSPEGNIALSVILRPDISCLPYLVMLASLAVVHSIEALTGLKPQIKWPNDVLVGGKKVCGILIENEMKGSRVDYAVVGIGINIGLKPADVPESLGAATSLNDELGRKVSCLAVVRNLLVEMERLYLTLPDGEAIYTAWRDKLVTLGKDVSVASDKGVLEGVAESVNKSGALVIRHADGSTTAVVAGDVTLRHR
jgi:BirA family biotin operon repressor/biotin-[acetyl-CoA-carboxylase] ligase